MYIYNFFKDSLDSVYGMLWCLFIILSLIGQMRLFEKAGEKWWYAIIPFYNAYVFQKITFGADKGWTFILFIVPVLGPLFAIYSLFKFFRAFGLNTGLAVVGIIVTPFVMIYIGFSDGYEYQGSQELV